CSSDLSLTTGPEGSGIKFSAIGVPQRPAGSWTSQASTVYWSPTSTLADWGSLRTRPSTERLPVMSQLAGEMHEVAATLGRESPYSTTYPQISLALLSSQKPLGAMAMYFELFASSG